MDWTKYSQETLLYLRVVGLIVGCLAKFVTGSLFVFNVYEDAIKNMFNYTEKEVELQSSLLNLGLGVGVVPGIFYDRFGPTWTSVLGLLTSLTAYMLLWSTTKWVDFYRPRSWLMGIFFFLAGIGSIFTYMVALNTNAINFDKKHRGKIVGLLNAFFSGSPSLFSVMYYQVFSHGNSTDPENQNYSGFLLMFAILFTITDIFCILLIRIYPTPEMDDKTFLIVTDTKSGDEMIPPLVGKEQDLNFNDGVMADARAARLSFRTDSHDSNSLRSLSRTAIEVSQVVNNDTIVRKTHTNSVTITKTPDEQDSGHEAKSLPVLKLLINVDYHLFVWMFSAAASIGLVYTNNITQVARSVHLKDYNHWLVLIIPISSAIVSLLVGGLSDKFKDRIPRMGFILLGTLLFILCQVLGLLFADKLAILVISTLFCGLGIAIIWSIGPAMMSEMFDLKDFGRNWGIALFVAALIGMGAQEVFGAMYDAQITTPGSNDCYGMACIRGGYAVFLGVAVLSLLVGLVTILRQKINRYCSRRHEK